MQQYDFCMTWHSNHNGDVLDLVGRRSSSRLFWNVSTCSILATIYGRFLHASARCLHAHQNAASMQPHRKIPTTFARTRFACRLYYIFFTINQHEPNLLLVQKPSASLLGHSAPQKLVSCAVDHRAPISWPAAAPPYYFSAKNNGHVRSSLFRTIF